MKIQDAPKYTRPREKLARYGIGKLNDEELLATILGSGMRGTNVVQLSRKILKRVDQEESVDLKTLSKIKGLGEVKAGKVLAVLELGKRRYATRPHIVLTPEEVFIQCKDIRESRREHFVAFYVNSRGVLIARETISIGTLTASLVHPREVFEPALRHGAVGIVVAHNHPSGDCTPSEDDELVTEHLKEVGELLGIELLDHVIVTEEAYRGVEVPR
ncbi:DNA repair protein RadC [Candidatus Kaiserbacteria bacterium]|nr:DNA repair protein RadC [Candidatus Kaiserbacteria bacterium]